MREPSKFCPRCSAQHHISAAFCHSCGAHFPPMPVIQNQPKKQNGMTLLIVCGIAVFGCAIFGGIFKALNGNKTAHVESAQLTPSPSPTPIPTPDLPPSELLARAKMLLARPYDRSAYDAAFDLLNRIPLDAKEHKESIPLKQKVTNVREREKVSAWQYSEGVDSMTGKITATASLRSTNSFEFGFPYSGAQHAALTLRKHPRYGNDIILSIEQGQFMPGIDGVAVLVRFDEDRPVRFWAVGPADHGTTTLFIGSYARFVSALRKAERVQISTKVYQEGEPVFNFYCAGLRRF